MAWVDYEKVYDIVPQTWMLENVQNIRESDKLRHESYGKLESRINSRRTNASQGENLKRHFQGLLTLAIIISQGNDAV